MDRQAKAEKDAQIIIEKAQKAKEGLGKLKQKILAFGEKVEQALTEDKTSKDKNTESVL
jgi:regulator of protease activity HflC (stomatin/prohibitin superfamily)